VLPSIGAIVVILIGSLVGPFVYGTEPDSAHRQRAFAVNDLFELEDVGFYYGGPYSFSPDGKKLAFTRVRPKKTLANHKWEFLWGNAGGDVWVQLNADEEPFNVTNGAQDGSGWWSPQWSPDGRRLAMLSTRGGNVRLWVWDADTRQLRQQTSRGVDLVADVHERPFLWVDAEHLLCPVLPGDEKPIWMEIELQTPTIASAAWPKVPKGDEITASVLESGVPVDLEKRPKGDLLLIDIASGMQKVVAHGNSRSWQLSPNGKTVVFARQVSMSTPKANEPIPLSTSGSFGVVVKIELVELDGTPITIHGELSQDVLDQTLRWSPDGNELAFVGYAAGRDQGQSLYRLNISRQTVVAQPLNDLDVVPIVREHAQMEWTATGDLIVRGVKHTAAGKPDVTARRDWWAITKDGAQKCLTEAIKDSPRQLWPQEGRQAFVGLADGKIWRLEPATSKTENLTAKFDPKVARISWPAMTNEARDEYRLVGRTYLQVIFSVEESGTFSPYLLDLQSGKIVPIEKPAPKAKFVAYTPLTSTGIFYASDRNGLQIWRGDVRNNQRTVLVSANGFLRDIAEGEFRQFEYTSLNGEKLKGWLILPFGYQPGKRYPVLAWVYAGWVAGDRPPDDSIDSNGSINRQIPAAHGYVVILPSMPLAPEGVAEDPMLRLPEGVLPAVDKVIEMGIGDPDRLFLIGQSFGGFSTYGLVTQTQRFKAAVSLAGLSDLISLYGQFDARERYTEHSQENLFMQALMESAQIRMGNPPWKDQGRYIRNSPIFYVDRVKTPLMIIQGDMDYVSMEQGEEFFVSLYRQGKRARFVRYWGEGHVLESPANIRDMWNQIFAWFDEFSKEEQPQGTGEFPRD